MFRRLIVWLEVKKQAALWRGELIRCYPTKELFDLAMIERGMRERAVLASVSAQSYKDGYREGFIKGHIDGFDHGAKVVGQVFRESADTLLFDARLGKTH
jgi:hypothetical protein